MARISEKVRDIVEVRPYVTVEDLIREPETSLSNYHFTDVTAFMMGRWLQSIGSGEPSEMCRAIAGFRGVGKSHFLATFAILMSQPELRSRVSDTHVHNATQQLLRRHYPVINVRRGLHGTFLEEFSSAICLTFDIAPEQAGSTLGEMVEAMVRRSGGLTPILIVDSAPERLSTIDRNDGEVLAELSEACKSSSVFIGLALDDDIAMADGSNMGVSRSFGIEYLDPEHLYKIVNSHIFPKNPRTHVILGSLYEDFKNRIPDFRWSEQRFNSLYPLHPALLELAPFIRTYLPRFSFFGFASSAAEKIMGRPADSMIGIDDVFDAIEFQLRKVEDLNSAFETFDLASAQIGTEMPVAARHKAKLVLKTLFINSLSQRCLSSSEIAAMMLISDDGEPGSSVRDIEAMLSGYALAFPKAITVDRGDGSNTRYRFNIGSDEFSNILNARVQKVDADTIETAFHAAIGERFPEIADLSNGAIDGAEIVLIWRGSCRPGRIIASNGEMLGPKRLDWEVFLDIFEERQRDPSGSVPVIEWKIGQLTSDERRSFAALTVLTSDQELRTKFPEQFPPAMLAAQKSVAGAVERVMTGDARLVIDAFDYNFSDAALATGNLTEMMGAMLEPLFETIYPEHPYFVETLDAQIVDRFVEGLSDNESSSGDQAALTFGVPLGIVAFENNGYAVLRKELLAQTPNALTVLDVIGNSIGSEPTEIAEVETALAAPPVALSSEAVRLILSAMAHRGLIELITADGERIGGRSIDLKLDWGNIAYVAAPRESRLSLDELLEWARLITGEPSIRSLSDPKDRSKILEEFVEISTQWDRRDPFEAFEQVSDCAFNTRIWRHSNQTWDAYAAMVNNINEALIGNISVDECLERICSSFVGRPEAFHESRSSVTAVEDFVRAMPDIERIETYLSLADSSSNHDVELSREVLRAALNTVNEHSTEQNHRDLGYAWDKFLRIYTGHYVKVHEASRKTNDFRFFAEQAIGSDERISRIFNHKSMFNHHEYKRSLRAIKRRYSAIQCALDPTPVLQTRPFCNCGFRLSQSNERSMLADSLRSLIEATVGAYMKGNSNVPEPLVADELCSSN